MQIILAPSKTMDVSRSLPAGCMVTEPAFLTEATELARAFRNEPDITRVMRMSGAVAERTKRLYGRWGEKKTAAVMAYVGDVYKGFHAETLSAEDVAWAQRHVFIMSGLYGVVRPQDAVSPYRLEMKAALQAGDANNLYDFWGGKLARTVDDAAGGVVVVLSSDEYARPVTKFSKSRLVTPVFLDKKPTGAIGTVPIYSKMMRGVMARWIIDNRINDPACLKNFRAQGYAYDNAHSTDDQPAFYRENSAPIVF